MTRVCAHRWREIRTGMFAGWSKCLRCYRRRLTAEVNAELRILLAETDSNGD